MNEALQGYEWMKKRSRKQKKVGKQWKVKNDWVTFLTRGGGFSGERNLARQRTFFVAVVWHLQSHWFRSSCSEAKRRKNTHLLILYPYLSFSFIDHIFFFLFYYIRYLSICKLLGSGINFSYHLFFFYVVPCQPTCTLFMPYCSTYINPFFSFCFSFSLTRLLIFIASLFLCLPLFPCLVSFSFPQSSTIFLTLPPHPFLFLTHLSLVLTRSGSTVNTVSTNGKDRSQDWYLTNKMKPQSHFKEHGEQRRCWRSSMKCNEASRAIW